MKPMAIVLSSIVTAILVGVLAAIVWALAGAVLFEHVWPGHAALTDEVFKVTAVATLLAAAWIWVKNLLSGW